MPRPQSARACLRAVARAPSAGMPTNRSTAALEMRSGRRFAGSTSLQRSTALALYTVVRVRIRSTANFIGKPAPAKTHRWQKLLVFYSVSYSGPDHFLKKTATVEQPRKGKTQKAPLHLSPLHTPFLPTALRLRIGCKRYTRRYIELYMASQVPR